jgi:hypothetical protein
MPTWTNPTTRSTGALISASIWNTDLVENLKYLKDVPVFAGLQTTGQALVGISSARTLTSQNALLQVETAGSTNSQLSLVTNRNDTGGVGLVLGKSRGTVTGSNTIVSNGDNLGFLWFNGADGVNMNAIAAQIIAQVDAAPGAGSMPGRLVFSTTPSGSASPVERMRLPSAGGVQCVTTLSVGNATPASTGAGITFPAAASASSDANTLDDYEEGTFTPTLGGTWTSNPTSLAGTYTKIGRAVFLRVVFVGGTKSGAATGFFTSLPFATTIDGTGTVADTNGANKGLCITSSSNLYVTDNSFSAVNNLACVWYFN